jgi:Zn-dependent peptidase ImmA (M78 family)
MPRAGYPLAAPSYLPKDQVFELAQTIAQQLNYNPGGDLGETVEKLGGSVVIEDTLADDPERSGSLYVDSPDDFTIIVPAHTSRIRDRFTVAHELGHYILHYLWHRQVGDGAPDRVMALRRGSDRIEWEANWFAAGFLMPEIPFRSSFSRLGGSLGRVADEFGVSTTAAEIRAKQLGLINEDR